MPWALVVAHVALPLTVAAAAAWGAWRCWGLSRNARDARLLNLMWFYGLFAASLVSFAIWTGRLAASVGATLSGGPSPGLSETLSIMHGDFAAAQRIDLFLIAHHALMLASLTIAVRAFSRKRAPAAWVAAIVGLSFLGPSILVALALEGALTMYLAVRAIMNHRRRRTPGALQVAAGFLLFALGHLSFLVFYRPGGARSPIGDVLSLLGIVLLVRLLPRPSA